MASRLLLDENVEHEVGHRLENYGHDVVHVDFEPKLGKGATDRSLAEYTLAEDRVLVTYDDDFVLTLEENAFSEARNSILVGF
jgi:predicted nuclease of predicted toxin-antitoxin system